MQAQGIEPNQVYIAQKHGRQIRVRTVMRSFDSRDLWVCTDSETGAREYVEDREFVRRDDSGQASY
jgi:hypothetical protein